MTTYRPTGFSLLLRKLRERSKKSRYRLAQFTGASEAYLYRLETGERQNPSKDTLNKSGV